MIDTSKISDAPRSLLFRCKYVLLIVSSGQGYEQHSRMGARRWIESEYRNVELAARQFPVRRRRERPGAKVCQEDIAGMAAMVTTNIIDQIGSN